MACGAPGYCDLMIARLKALVEQGTLWDASDSALGEGAPPPPLRSLPTF